MVGWAAAPRATPVRLPARPTLRGRPAWRFELHALDGPAGHIAAVARGPAADAVDEGGAFVATLLAPGRAVGDDDDNSGGGAAAAAPPPAFTVLALSDLLPDAARAGYDRAAGGGGGG